MRKLLALLCTAGLLLVLAAPAWAEYDEGDLKEIEQKLKDGKGFSEQDVYPNKSAYSQTLLVSVGIGVAYKIDFRAHLCFSGGDAPVPCKAIKIGYPAIGKLITWEKDGWAE